MILLVLLCVAVLCVCAWYCQRQWHLEKLTANIPCVGGRLPIIGHAHLCIGDTERLWNTLQAWGRESIESSDGIIKGWMGPVLFIGVCDPDIALALSNICLEKNYLYRFSAGWLGDGLVTGNGSKWKRHRKLFSPAFNQQILNEFLDVFNKQSSRLVDNFATKTGKGFFDQYPYLAENGLETICQTALGVPEDEESVVNKEYAEAMDRLMEIYMSRCTQAWMHPDWVYNLTSLKKEEVKNVQILTDMSNALLTKQKDRMQSKKVYGTTTGSDQRFKPFLALLLEIAKEVGLSDKEVREEIDTIIAAGYDTTSITLLCLTVMLGSYSEVQEKVYKELKAVFGSSSRDVTKEDLSKLVYTEAVVKETLRLHPPAPFTARHVPKEVRIENFTIPGGCDLVLSNWAVNRHKTWGPDALEFRPERWLDPAAVPEGAYAAFSLGKRSCIGRNYAMMSMKTAVVHLVRRFRIRADHTQLKMRFDFILKPVSGHCVAVEER